ncbi:MAG: aldose 1-epimerase [Anaerolineae bacterium]|nr:aldose 1-epimerase [Thermoflexales bacterium]MDW8407822.1 aldose 1-epimerase [Anaerolineae bacterium]
MSRTIQTDRLSATIAPELGASLVAFELWHNNRSTPLMRPTPPDALARRESGQTASFVMLPWSNRIAQARFVFQEHAYTLQPNTPQGFAIHGDARQRPWQLTNHHDNNLTCTLDSRDFADYNFPFPLRAELEYALTDSALSMTLTLTNVGDRAMPAGFGFHPYFNRGFGASERDEAHLQIRVRGVYPPLPGMAAKPVGEAGDTSTRLSELGGPMFPLLPEQDFSALQTIGNREIDHCFGGWDGRAIIAYPSAGVRLRFECDPLFTHVVIYTPAGKAFFAVEPVTIANNGFNLHAAGLADTGTQILRPGESLRGRFRIHIEFEESRDASDQ